MTAALHFRSNRFYQCVTRIVSTLDVGGVYIVNAIQLILDNLSTDHEERLEAVIDALTNDFLNSLADQACLDLHELQTALAVNLAFTAGAVLRPESALHFSAMMADAIHAGATIEPEGQGVEEPSESVTVSGLH